MRDGYDQFTRFSHARHNSQCSIRVSHDPPSLPLTPFTLSSLRYMLGFFVTFCRKSLKKTFFYSFPYCLLLQSDDCNVIVIFVVLWVEKQLLNVSLLEIAYFHPGFPPRSSCTQDPGSGLRIRPRKNKLHLSLGVWALRATLHLTSSIFVCTQGHLKTKKISKSKA